MDYSHIGFDVVWEDEAAMREEAKKATAYGFIFAWFGLNLLVSIVRTIATSPGNIPEDNEWDMASGTEQSQEEEAEGLIKTERSSVQERFTNPVIDRLTERPIEAVHEDYKYLTTGVGPLVEHHNIEVVEPRQQTQKAPIIVSIEKKKFGGVRICQWCFKAKPDRCHHCSQCNRCVLKMDHHCPWVANCIGFYNFKFFFNMIFHGAITCQIVVWTSYPILARTLTNP